MSDGITFKRPGVKTVHVEIPGELIDDWIRIYLSGMGIDSSKEMRQWPKFENNKVIFVYEQDSDAKEIEKKQPILKTSKEVIDTSKRPAWLDKM